MGLPMSEIRIRRLVPADAKLFRSIRLEALMQSPEAYGSSFEEESANDIGWFADRLTSSEVFAAVSGDEVVGIAGIVRERRPKSRHKAHLWGVYVRPGARGAGVARSLCEAAIEAARGKADLIQLTVLSENGQARQLYESLGFVPFGLERRARKVGDRYYDDVLMAMDLDGP